MRAAAAGTFLFVLAVATWPIWWGGHCYGPRLLADINPILALALCRPFGQISSRPRRWRILLALTVAFSLFVQMRGVVASKTVDEWNRAPASGGGEKVAGKAWDWKDMQMFHGIL